MVGDFLGKILKVTLFQPVNLLVARVQELHTKTRHADCCAAIQSALSTGFFNIFHFSPCDEEVFRLKALYKMNTM